jgi:transcriptional regulator with PAS, ATPase and Fis domain
LRVLEEKEFRPVGSPFTKRSDVRFITATNKNLSYEVNNNRFRSDLFYRLNVIPIFIPPLRERPEDIPLLSEHFLRKYSTIMNKDIKGFSKEAKDALCSYNWPGNIRELENLIHRAVALAEGDILDVSDLFEAIVPQKVTMAQPEEDISAGISLDEKIKELETYYLRKALQLSGGNHTKAAQLLKMSLSSFRYKLQKYKINSQ